MRLFGVKLKYYFSIKAWKSWLRGQIVGSDLKQEYVEQVMYRMTHPECKECIRLGKCVDCGCDTFKKMLDPQSECSKQIYIGDYNGEPMYEPPWGPMSSKAIWNEEKQRNGLEFIQKLNKVKSGV